MCYAPRMDPDPTRPRFGVLFDVGYTLLDESARLDAALAWTRDALAETGVSVATTGLHRAYIAACTAPDPDEPSLLVQSLASLGVDREAARAIRRRLPWDTVPLEPYADAADALRLLHDAGLKLGVLANQPASAREDLGNAGLLPFFDDVWLSDAVGMHKPDPAFFRLALSVWSLPPDRVAYVGDRPDNDVAPAKRLGMRTVRLHLGPHRDQPPTNPDQHPDFEADSLLAAAKRLRAWAEANA